MTAPRHAVPRASGSTRRVRFVTAVFMAVAAAYAGVASATTAFTVPADVAVSAPSFLFAGVLLMERLYPEAGPWRRIDGDRPEGGGTAVPWLLLVVLLIGVELASYFHTGPRADYPTISSGLNTLFRYRAARAAVWWVWLTVGWHLARR